MSTDGALKHDLQQSETDFIRVALRDRYSQNTRIGTLCLSTCEGQERVWKAVVNIMQPVTSWTVWGATRTKGFAMEHRWDVMFRSICHHQVARQMDCPAAHMGATLTTGDHLELLVCCIFIKAEKLTNQQGVQCGIKNRGKWSTKDEVMSKYTRTAPTIKGNRPHG